MHRLKTGVLVGLLLGGVSLPAQAAPLEGAFSKVGNFVPVIGGVADPTASILDATGLDFTALFGNVASPGVPGQFLVLSGTDDFAFLVGQVGQIVDLTFSGPGNVLYPNVPIASFEIALGLTFDLLTVALTSSGIDPVSGLPTIQLGGMGTFNLAGFDPTPGAFVFTGNQAGATFSFSASQIAVPVPEPASMLLLGLGLFGTAAVARRRRRT